MVLWEAPFEAPWEMRGHRWTGGKLTVCPTGKSARAGVSGGPLHAVPQQFERRDHKKAIAGPVKLPLVEPVVQVPAGPNPERDGG
jgi:hypothetical protein